jgi:hypothetical protein
VAGKRKKKDNELPPLPASVLVKDSVESQLNALERERLAAIQKDLEKKSQQLDELQKQLDAARGRAPVAIAAAAAPQLPAVEPASAAQEEQAAAESAPASAPAAEKKPKKRKQHAEAVPHKAKTRKTRASVSYETKLQVLNKLRGGAKACNLALEFGVSEQAISAWRGKEDVIRAAVANGYGSQTKHAVGTFSIFEGVVANWFQRQRQRRVPISDELLLESASNLKNEFVTLYGQSDGKADLATKEAAAMTEAEFVPSKHWLQRFKRRWRISTRTRHGEGGGTALRCCTLALAGDVDVANSALAQAELREITKQFVEELLYNMGAAIRETAEEFVDQDSQLADAVRTQMVCACCTL